MEAQIRLKMKPVDSFRAVYGCSPALRSSFSRSGKMSLAVCPEVISSTIMFFSRVSTWRSHGGEPGCLVLPAAASYSAC